MADEFALDELSRENAKLREENEALRSEVAALRAELARVGGAAFAQGAATKAEPGRLSVTRKYNIKLDDSTESTTVPKRGSSAMGDSGGGSGTGSVISAAGSGSNTSSLTSSPAPLTSPKKKAGLTMGSLRLRGPSVAALASGRDPSESPREEDGVAQPEPEAPPRRAPPSTTPPLDASAPAVEDDIVAARQPSASPRRGLFSRAAEALSIRKSGGVSRTNAKDVFAVSPPPQRLMDDEGAGGAPVEQPATAAAAATAAGNAAVAPPLLASISSPTLVDAAKPQGEHVSVSVLSSKRVHKHQFFMIGVSKPGQKDWTITPRRVQDFRDMHATLTKAVGEVSMPAFSLKKMAGNDKDLGQALQDYLQALVAAEATCSSKVLKAFLDPYDNPSAFCASEVLVASKKGPLMVMMSRVWRPHFAVLCNSLYYYRSDEDPAPAGVLSLEYVTIEIVREHKEMAGWPQHVFKVIDLLKGSETLFGLETTKEVGEWILALREAKVNKMGLGYWVKAPGEDDAPLPEPLVKRKLELDAGFEIFHQWLQNESSGQPHSQVTTLEQFATLLKVAPPDVSFDDDSLADASTLWLRERPDGELPQLMGATKTRLLQLLLDPEYDESFIQVFLTTYQLFLTAPELFVLIVHRHQSCDEWSPVRDRCTLVLSQWVGLHYFDFARNQMLAMCLLDFVSLFIDRESDAFASVSSVIAAMDNTDARSSKQWLKMAPKPMLPDIYHRHMFDFIDLHPIEVARQLTILEFQLFAAIEGRELLNQCWNGDNKEHDAPNVTLTISRFNQMSGWITTLMVKVQDLKPRVALLKRFIDIARACMELNNFNSVVEIVSGLGTTAVRRLTDTWDLLPDETKDLFQQMKDFLETRKNWERYRTRLASCTPPCVPYLGLYLTDLVMVDEVHKKRVAHPDYPEAQLYNVERLARITQIHSDVKTYQVVRYCLKPVSYFQEYLQRLDQMSADECYALSTQIQKKK